MMKLPITAMFDLQSSEGGRNGSVTWPSFILSAQGTFCALTAEPEAVEGLLGEQVLKDVGKVLEEDHFPLDVVVRGAADTGKECALDRDGDPVVRKDKGVVYFAVTGAELALSPSFPRCHEGPHH